MGRGWLLMIYILAINTGFTIATYSEEVDDSDVPKGEWTQLILDMFLLTYYYIYVCVSICGQDRCVFMHTYVGIS